MTEINLDVKDRKILYQLDVDARQSLSAIARKVGLSREVVNYRISNLEKQGVIEGYYTVLDVSKLSYMYCRILIKYESISLEQEQEILQYVKNLPEVGWYSRNDGRWDLTLIVLARNVTEFEKVYDKLRYNIGRFAQEMIASIAFRIYHFRHNYLFGTHDYSQLVLGGSSPIKLEGKDFKILHALAGNARLPIVELSKKVGLSANAAKARLKKLVTSSVILGFRAKINSALLGFEHYKVFLSLQGMSERRQVQLISWLQHNSSVIYVTKAFGIADLEFEAMLRSQRELHGVMQGLRQKFPEEVKGYDWLLIFEEPALNYLPREV